MYYPQNRSTLNTFYTPNYVDGTTMPNRYDLFYPADRFYSTLVNSSTPIDYRQFRQRPQTPASGSLVMDGSSSDELAPIRGRLIVEDNVTYRKKDEPFDMLGIPDNGSYAKSGTKSKMERAMKSTVGNVIDAFESMSRQSYNNVARSSPNIYNTVQKNKYSTGTNAAKYNARARPKPLQAFGSDLDTAFPITKVPNQRTSIKDNLK